MLSPTVLVFIPALLAVISFGQTKDHARTVSWGELAQEVQSYWTLRIVLPDGTVVQGEPAKFITKGLTMQVEKSSDNKLHPKGAIFIPREQVKMLNIRTNRPVGRAVDRHFQQVPVAP